MEENPKTVEWRAGRSNYQKVKILAIKKALNWLRLHPNSTSTEIYDNTKQGVSGISKYLKSQVKESGEIVYTVRTLEEVIKKENKKYAT